MCWNFFIITSYHDFTQVQHWSINRLIILFFISLQKLPKTGAKSRTITISLPGCVTPPSSLVYIVNSLVECGDVSSIYTHCHSSALSKTAVIDYKNIFASTEKSIFRKGASILYIIYCNGELWGFSIYGCRDPIYVLIYLL